jgi:hypothetical protein
LNAEGAIEDAINTSIDPVQLSIRKCLPHILNVKQKLVPVHMPAVMIAELEFISEELGYLIVIPASKSLLKTA